MTAPPEWFATIQAIGILSFGVNTMVLARQRDFGVAGVMMVTVAASVGGSTMRDVILGPRAQPFAWVHEPGLLLITLVVAWVYMTATAFREAIERRHFLITDGAETIAAASLAMFGVERAVALLADQVNAGWRGQVALPLLATLVALIGSTGGTVLRDLMLGKRPKSFRRDSRQLEQQGLVTLLVALLLVAGVARQPVFAGGFFALIALRSTGVRRVEA